MSAKANSKKINWQPEHFPVGTVVVLGNYTRKNGDFCRIFDADSALAEVTVTGIVMNSLDSYLIRTGEINKNLDIEHVFNVDHVKSIVKRGNGPVKVEYYRSFKTMPNLKAGISSGLLNKNKYYFYYTQEITSYLISMSSLPKNLRIKEGFENFLLMQSFVKKEGQDRYPLYSMDKKKARRFIQQNINRWIVPMKTIRAQIELEEKRMYEDYCKDLDGEFDSDYHPGCRRKQRQNAQDELDSCDFGNLGNYNDHNDHSD